MDDNYEGVLGRLAAGGHLNSSTVKEAHDAIETLVAERDIYKHGCCDVNLRDATVAFKRAEAAEKRVGELEEAVNLVRARLILRDIQGAQLLLRAALGVANETGPVD